jgi:hypothetical protein
MDAAKVRLSKEEMALVADPGWILTKNSIMERAVQLMARLSERMGPELEGLRYRMNNESAGYDPPSDWNTPNWDTPKISRGENYLGLPYVVLDFPRLFTKEHVLAIRTLFWWGNYFSVTLHLKGWVHALFLGAVERHSEELAAAGFQIALSGDEWQHALDGGNYVVLTRDSIDPEGEYPFVKIAAKCGLDQWNEAPERLFGLFRVLVRVLSEDQFSGR